MDLDEEKISSVLKGNTLRVYWHILKSHGGVAGVRDTQRALGFSSPALAIYHLEKLVEMGLVEKSQGEYRLVKVVDVGVLKQFVRLGTFLFPRYLLYAMMFTTLLIFFLTQFKQINFYSLFALILGLLGTSIFWYETISAWKQRP